MSEAVQATEDLGLNPDQKKIIKRTLQYHHSLSIFLRNAEKRTDKIPSFALSEGMRLVKLIEEDLTLVIGQLKEDALL